MSGRERSASGLERHLMPYALSLIAANVARPMDNSVTLMCPFLTQEVLHPMYLKSSTSLSVRVLRKIRIKGVGRLLQGWYGQEQLGTTG